MREFKTKALRKCIKTIQRKFHYEISPLEQLQLEVILRRLKKDQKSKHKKKKWTRYFDIKQWIETLRGILQYLL